MPSRTIQGCGLGVVFQQPARPSPEMRVHTAVKNFIAVSCVDGSGEMNESQSAHEQIREFVMPIAQRMGVHRFSDEESLINSGIMGSLELFRLVSFLEETFSVTIADEEIVAENFDSIDKINCFVMSKRILGGEPQS